MLRACVCVRRAVVSRAQAASSLPTRLTVGRKGPSADAQVQYDQVLRALHDANTRHCDAVGPKCAGDLEAWLTPLTLAFYQWTGTGFVACVPNAVAEACDASDLDILRQGMPLWACHNESFLASSHEGCSIRKRNPPLSKQR